MPKRAVHPKSGRLKLDRLYYIENIDKLIAILLVLGIVEVNVVNVENGSLTFTLRGPALQRLTSGAPLTMQPVGTGVFAEAYLRIEALIAFLLFIGEAQTDIPAVSATTTVWGISSEWFRLSALRALMKDNQHTVAHRTAILRLLNLALGVGLISRKLEFSLTGFGLTPTSNNLQVRFFISGPPFSKLSALTAGKYTPPPHGNESLYWMGVVVGILLIAQQARAVNVGVERAGAVGFDVSTFSFKGLPRYMQKLLMALRK